MNCAQSSDHNGGLPAVSFWFDGLKWTLPIGQDGLEK
jgi:hypothetical protein